MNQLCGARIFSGGRKILKTLLTLSMMCALFQSGALGAGHQVVSVPILKKGMKIPKPVGKVVLVVKGATAKSNYKGAVAFDKEALEKLGLVKYPNKNRWFKKEVVFEGVLLSALLDVVGVPKGATTLKLKALDGYAAYVPISDGNKWPVMLALKMDGKYMSVRGKGPIWMVYPTHLDPELGGVAHEAKWVWQISEISIQ